MIRLQVVDPFNYKGYRIGSAIRQMRLGGQSTSMIKDVI
jgi:hypothetical protein